MMDYFTDPVLRGPTLGSMLMCFSAALIGVIAFLRKQSLIGEAISHAAYPGVIIGVIIAGALGFDDRQETIISLMIMVGASISALIALACITFLELKYKVRRDSALCFILSAFFGIGITLASRVQFSYSRLYKQITTYIYGQAATMTDRHILIYAILSILVILGIILFYKEIQAITFDRQYSKSLGLPVKRLDILVFFLIAIAVVIGIRSVGVVLMSAMLIAPATAARQFTNRLSIMLILAGIFGLLSGYFGNYSSVELSRYYLMVLPQYRLIFPTGPMIVIVASLITLIALMVAPERGLLLRFFRIMFFRYRCIQENVLKALWRYNREQSVSFEKIAKFQAVSRFYLKFILWRLVYKGLVQKCKDDTFLLTEEGKHQGAKIVRLHRLWEVYLADYMGVGAEKVHRNAEEMEHILTPQLEKELTLLLKDPKLDPHHQPIPPGED